MLAGVGFVLILAVAVDGPLLLQFGVIIVLLVLVCVLRNVVIAKIGPCEVYVFIALVK